MGMHRQNQFIWGKMWVVAAYRKYSELQPPEEAILAELREEMAGKRILDIGVGGGRTTPYLLELSSDYIGIDYAPAMIKRCKAQYPSVSFELADARDLSRFAPASFDLIFFSFNGIDYVDHADRLKILDQVRRLLAPQGVFVFSAHNRDTPLRCAWDLSHFNNASLLKPLGLAKRLLLYLNGIMNSFFNVRKEMHMPDYAIINDEAHEYSLLTYYISIESQVRQLKDCGFRSIQVYGLNGKTIDWEHATSHDPWIYYLCRI
jgi:SAM-dependent methyltransferase